MHGTPASGPSPRSTDTRARHRRAAARGPLVGAASPAAWGGKGQGVGREWGVGARKCGQVSLT
eukprot:13855-Chlamydomonas_euryale.AAC.1